MPGCRVLAVLAVLGAAEGLMDEHGALLATGMGETAESGGAGRTGPVLRNVLLITIDDLRPELKEAYGLEQAITPNIDKLAEGGTTFQHAYCQMAVCSPSRNSFMTGRRPDTTKVWNFIDHFRAEDVGAGWTTFPEYFKNHGYLTYGQGKLYHPDRPPGNDYPVSWTVDAYNHYYWGNNATSDAKGCGSTDSFRPTQTIGYTGGEGNVCPGIDHPDDDYYDHQLASRTLESLDRAAAAPDKNFFMAIGIRRPHLSWRMPRRFWDMYANTTIALAKQQTLGQNTSIVAFERNGGMSATYLHTATGEKYTEGPGPRYPSPDGAKSPLPEDLQRTLRRGYYASVSFMDHEVGRVLDRLDQLGLTDSTAVLFHADHGWKLGEHGDWSKCSNWELDARVPLILRAPWIPASVGARTAALAELVDLFPTAVHLSGLPPVPESERLEGLSLVPLLENPSKAVVKEAAFSQYVRCPEYSIWTASTQWECLYTPRSEFTLMGYSVRVADYRYTEWRTWNGTHLRADWADGGLYEVEMYAHDGDDGMTSKAFDEYENVNLAREPRWQGKRAELADILSKHFRHDAE